MSDEPASLAQDTAVTPVERVPGLYTCSLSDRWSYLHPCGGVLMTIALRAMKASLADEGLHALSATTIFCQPVLPGELHIDVEILRAGKSAAQARATVRTAGTPGAGLVTTATFARDREGPDVHGVTMPQVPSPDEAERTATRRGELAPKPFKIYENLELALALGEPMWKSGWSKGPAHAAFWYRYKVPQTEADGSFDPLALPPIADTMPPALVRRLGPEDSRYMMPSLDLTVYFIAPAKTSWVLVESFVERARAGYAVGSANLWDESGQLIARAAQTMLLKKLGRR